MHTTHFNKHNKLELSYEYNLTDTHILKHGYLHHIPQLNDWSKYVPFYNIELLTQVKHLIYM